MSLGPIVVPGCRPQAHGGEAGIELGVGSFTPSDRAPSLGVELLGQGLGRDRLVIVGSADLRRRPASSAARLGRQRALAWAPDAECGLNADNIGQTELGQARAEIAVGAISGVGQNHAGRDAPGLGRPDLLERDLRLGPERDLCRNLGLLALLRILRPAVRRYNS